MSQDYSDTNLNQKLDAKKNLSFKDIDSLKKIEKRPINEIIDDSNNIEVVQASKEILIWVANNVEEFIDNKKRMFKLDIAIDVEEGAEETMPEIRKLQDLYRSVPEDPTPTINKELSYENYNEIINSLDSKDQELIIEIQKCKTKLDEKSDQIFSAMKNNHELLKALFRRMAFYYEIQGINNGELLLQEVEGEVDIIKFEYEDFPVAVTVNSADKIEAIDDNGNMIVADPSLENTPTKEYIIPEGFTIWLEIAFKSKNQKMPSLF